MDTKNSTFTERYKQFTVKLTVLYQEKKEIIKKYRLFLEKEKIKALRDKIINKNI